MKLVEIVASLNFVPDEETIYATEPWSPNSEAITAPEPDTGSVPPEAEKAGMRYFLEVFLAKQVLEGWEQTQRTPPSIDSRSQRLIEYATNDA